MRRLRMHKKAIFGKSPVESMFNAAAKISETEKFVAERMSGSQVLAYMPCQKCGKTTPCA